MKRIIFIVGVLLCNIRVSVAQNIPNGAAFPLSPTVSPVTLPATYTPPAGGYNFTRTFIPLTASIPGSPVFTFAPAPGDFFSYTCKVQTTYTNGWGGEIQTISRGFPPYTPDLLKPKDGRLSLANTDFLPYALTACSHFQPTSFADQLSYYNVKYPDEVGFSYTQSVTSYPVSFPSVIPTEKSCAAGSSFVGNNNGNTITTTINDGTEGIIMYPVLGTTPIAYPAGQLTIKTTLTPNGSQTKEYFDKDNREVCKKVWGNCMISGSDWMTTYYIYDDENKLVQIYTPSATRLLAADPTSIVTNLSYSYSYNAYGSQTNTTTPGQSGSEYVVYDLKNRPVLYQSPLLASMGKFKFNIYDSRDRVIISGYFTDVNDYSFWQNKLYYPPSIFMSGTLIDLWINGFTGAYPTSITACEIEQVNYYDTYPFTRTFDATSTCLTSEYVDDHPAPYMLTQGLLTTSLSRVRDGGTGPSSDKWVCSVNFYDYKARLIQTQTINPWFAQPYATCMAGAPYATWDTHTFQYSFTGQVVSDFIRYHDLPTSDKPVTTITAHHEYDMQNGGRLKWTRHFIDCMAFIDIAKYTYDDLGRVITKSQGGVEVQNYDYNIRGQLTGINRSYVYSPCSVPNVTFGCILDYDFGFTEPRVDGKISGMIWRGADHTSPMRAYGYEYEPAGRLINAEFRQYCDPGLNTISCPPPSVLTQTWNKNHTDFTVSNIKYDYNGNLLEMFQQGTTATGPVAMDQLFYGYTPNTDQLANVTDYIATDFHLGDFVDVTGEGNDYTYDADGNLTHDRNKHITTITNNEMDQPLAVTFDDGSTITNTYTADGTLITKTIAPASAAATTYHYWGPFVYSSASTAGPFSLQYLLHDEGRARYNASTGYFTYDYFVKDHLGNVRTVVTGNQTNEIVGTTFAYGDVHSGGDSTGVDSTGGSSGGAFDSTAFGMGVPGAIDTNTTQDYLATHEIAMGGIESAVFTNIDSVRDYKPASIDSADMMAARLDAGDPSHTIGTAIMLKVMAGDQFDFSAQSYWDASDSGTSTISSSTLLSSIISTLTCAQNGVAIGDNTATQLVSDAFTPDNFALYQAMIDSTTNPDVPQTYIYYMMFDEYMNLIPDQSGAVQIGATPGGWMPISSGGPHTVGSSGYLAVFVGTASVGTTWVDVIHVGLSSGPLIQEQHYYPFGLTINEGESSSAVRNKFKYQGKELYDDIKLNLYDFTARQYDPQIGRFWGIDPASQFPSGYTGMGNDPSNMIDPTGCAANTTNNYVGDPNILARYARASNDENILDPLAEMSVAGGESLEMLRQEIEDYQKLYCQDNQTAVGAANALALQLWGPNSVPISPSSTINGVTCTTYGHKPSLAEMIADEMGFSNKQNSIFGPIYADAGGKNSAIAGVVATGAGAAAAGGIEVTGVSVASVLGAPLMTLAMVFKTTGCATGDVADLLHGNDSRNPNPQNLYAIYNSLDNDVMKYGITGLQENPENRPQYQVNAFNRNGKGPCNWEWIEQNIPGRMKAYEREAYYVWQYMLMHNWNPPSEQYRPTFKYCNNIYGN